MYFSKTSATTPIVEAPVLPGPSDPFPDLFLLFSAALIDFCIKIKYNELSLFQFHNLFLLITNLKIHIAVQLIYFQSFNKSINTSLLFSDAEIFG